MKKFNFKNIKNKKAAKIGASIFVTLLFIVAITTVMVKTNFIGKLYGQIISADIDNNYEKVNTGVIVDNKYFNIYKENQDKVEIPIIIYNGASTDMTIKQIYLYGTDNEDDQSDYDRSEESKKYIQTSDIKINPDTTYIYKLYLDTSTLEASGESSTINFNYNLNDKNYVIGSYFMTMTDNMNQLDSTLNTYRKDEVPATFAFNNGDNNVTAKLSGSSIYMDISENLEDLDINYTISSSDSANWNFFHPQSKEALTKNILGNSNISNISNYFTFSNQQANIEKNGVLDSDSGSFKLTGTPNGIYTNEKVTLGTYFTKVSNGETISSETNNYTANELPYFTLTTYDKSRLKNSFKKLFYNLYGMYISQIDNSIIQSEQLNNINIITSNAQDLLQSADVYGKDVGTNGTEDTKVTQEEIDKVTKEIDDFVIPQKPAADYSTLNATINNANSLNRSLYTTESLAVVDELVAKKEDDLRATYQIKIDNLNNKINDAINNLQYKPAFGYLDSDNYEPFEGAISIESAVKFLKNLDRNVYTENGLTKIDQMISEFDNNTDGIMDFTTNNQDGMDALLLKTYNSIKGLEKKPGDYTEFCKYYDEALNINKNYYDNAEGLTEMLWNINWDYKLDEQSKIDELTTNLTNKLDSLIIKDADYTEFNKVYDQASILNANYYVNGSQLTEAITSANQNRNLKIDKQAKVDEITSKLNTVIKNLVMKEADYSKIESLKATISQLNASKYTNFNIVDSALKSIVYGKKINEQTSVDAMYKALSNAYNSLNKKTADYSKLTIALAKIPTDYSKYDSSIQNEIKSLLAEAKLIATDLPYDEQSKIDNLTLRIETLVSKLPTIDSNNSSNQVILSYLKVNGNKVDISSNPFKYTVSYDVVSAEIEVGLSNKNSTSNVYGGKVLLPGDNNITIVVTNNGTKYTYNLVITRKQTSDYLSDLSVNKEAIKFNKTKQEYTVKVDKDTNKLDLSAIAEDENAKVTIKGNKNLKNGSKVTIEVESADGDLRVYTLNVQKNGSVDAKVIVILVMILAILAGLFKFVKEKKKSN